CLKNPIVFLKGVRLGEWNTSSDPDCDEGQCSDAVVNIPVVEQIPHEKYEPNSRLQLNDIALLRLARPVQYTNWIKPIPLPTVSDVNKNFDGVPLIASGWGTTEHAARSDIKLKVKLNGTSLDKCNVLYSGYGVTLTNLHLCAGGEKGKDSCKGDNGGPLIHENKSDPKNVQYSIVGVASFGSSPCGLKDVPGVYTRVDQYIDWISNHMNKQENR
ncbi:melanization protease 1-like, partial [Contarinia nasturtii]|uniref:melanization protease 1-like n=1 Tax=Contarinia nasturtii TaxID=265458 RepID=UPI0012D46BC0